MSSAIRDNWERLVVATLDREQLRYLSRLDSMSSIGSGQSFSLSSRFNNLGDALTYRQILRATDDFNNANLIKHGRSGDLFHGILDGGIRVVVKKVDLDSSEKSEFYASELETFSRVSHPRLRLVPLLGHCMENEREKFLVYKEMGKGDLSNCLFKKADSEQQGLRSLDWITRVKIAIGAAEGLSYLHHQCIPPLVHRDVQASSILVDDKFEVGLGSLSDVCAQEAGKIHQNRIMRLVAPRSRTPDLGNKTWAGDVYSFGKVLLELVTGKLGISSSSDAAMKDWLEMTLPCISIYDKELVINIVDPSLIIDEDLLEEVWAMAIVARSCLNPYPARRPIMRYVVKALQNPLKIVRGDEDGKKIKSSRSENEHRRKFPF